ncbi:MAG: hypothetical protein ABIN74_01060, partial [Ferruginibacter sp.]
VSGLRFFFWDSQFGRFFNNGPIKGKGDLSFFLHTSLWAFIPWSIVLLLAVINMVRRKNSTVNSTRWIPGGTVLISFLMFSVSKFQLPHYIVILFPHFAMMTASYLVEAVSEKALKRINVFQTVLFVLLVAAISWIIVIYSFNSYVWFLLVLGAIAVPALFYKPGNMLLAILKKNIGFALLLAIFLNCLFYPSLLRYQAGMMAGKWLNERPVTQEVIQYKSLSSSFDFYYNGKINYKNPTAAAINNLSGDSLLLFTALTDVKDINPDSVNINILKMFPYFHVSQVNGKFIDIRTRQETLEYMAIVLITRKTNSK